MTPEAGYSGTPLPCNVVSGSGTCRSPIDPDVDGVDGLPDRRAHRVDVLLLLGAADGREDRGPQLGQPVEHLLVDVSLSRLWRMPSACRASRSHWASRALSSSLRCAESRS